MGGTVGERRGDDRAARPRPACVGGTLQLRPNGPNSTAAPERLGGGDGRGDVRAGVALDERLDGELEQQHATEL